MGNLRKRLWCGEGRGPWPTWWQCGALGRACQVPAPAPPAARAAPPAVTVLRVTTTAAQLPMLPPVSFRPLQTPPSCATLTATVQLGCSCFSRLTRVELCRNRQLARRGALTDEAREHNQRTGQTLLAALLSGSGPEETCQTDLGAKTFSLEISLNHCMTYLPGLFNDLT